MWVAFDNQKDVRKTSKSHSIGIKTRKKLSTLVGVGHLFITRLTEGRSVRLRERCPNSPRGNLINGHALRRIRWVMETWRVSGKIGAKFKAWQLKNLRRKEPKIWDCPSIFYFRYKLTSLSISSTIRSLIKRNSA